MTPQPALRLPRSTFHAAAQHPAAAPSIAATLFCWQTFLLLFVLLFPTALFQQFFIGVTAVVLLCCWNVRPGGSWTAYLLAGFGLFLLAASVLRTLTYNSANVAVNDNLRDYFEIVRVIPLVIIFAYVGHWRSLRPEHFLWAFAIFLSLDGLVTFLQTTHSDLYGLQEIAATYYNAEHHLNVSLHRDGRALGLATGPGQHAAILGVALVVMLNAAFVSPRWTLVGAAGVCLASMLLACAQSQTGLIVVSLTVCGLLATHLFKGSARQRTLALTLVAVLGISVTSLLGLIAQFSYLNSLFTMGMNRNSYIVRQETRQYVLDQMAKTPHWYLIGYGKEYFGNLSAAMDNEYLYALAVYGLPMAVCLVLSALLLLIRLMLFTPQLTTNYWNLTLLGLLVLGLGFAWPVAFFTEPRSMAIFCLVMAAQQAHRSAPVPAGPIRRPNPMAPRPVRVIPHQVARTPSLPRR